jgi:hypothetical protein
MGELHGEKLDVAASPPCCRLGALSQLPIIFAIVIQNEVWSSAGVAFSTSRSQRSL